MGIDTIKLRSRRLRICIDRHFGDSRGKFKVLAEISGIAPTTWHNFYYEKINANDKMFVFWKANYPDDIPFIESVESDPFKKVWPFREKMPSENLTVKERVQWVVSEMTSFNGRSVCKYLSDQLKNVVSIEDWESALYGEGTVNANMLITIALIRPYFTLWVITGKQFPTDTAQVNPADEKSVLHWLNDMRRVAPLVVLD